MTTTPGSARSHQWPGPVVLAADDAYAMPLATTLRSIVESNRASWPIPFRILDSGVVAARQRQVADSLPVGSAEIRWCAVDLAPFAGCLTHAHISTATYARLLIPAALAPNESRALFLDSDVLVLADLSALWHTDLEGKPIAAVPDGMEPARTLGDPRFRGVPPVRSYFNAGVLLVDHEGWRRERVSEQALEYLASRPQSPFSDQDALNVACDGRWTPLASRWNFQAHYGTPIEGMPDGCRPAIVHFVTAAKPWNPWSRSVNARLYDAVRSRTVFARRRDERLRDAVCRVSAGIRNVARRASAEWRPLAR